MLFILAKANIYRAGHCTVNDILIRVGKDGAIY